MKTNLIITTMALLTISIMNTTCAQNNDFDIKKYLEQMNETPSDRYNIGDVVLTEYALIDIDGDGIQEVWVRGENNYQALYTVEGDVVKKIAYADGATDLVFYKNAVGYSAYYSPGRACEGAQVVKNSHLADSYDSEIEFDTSSEEQDVISESHWINGKESTSKACEKFLKRLGKPVEPPQPAWYAIK